MNEKFLAWKLLAGVIATVGLYSVLYRENKFYRFVEHVFLGLAAGFTIVAVWKETLYEPWWLRMVGSVPDATTGSQGTPGYFLYMLMLPFGLMAYMVFSKKHNWMSRIPIGIILGLWAGQQIQTFWNTWGKQIHDSMRPVFPTQGTFFVPDKLKMSPEEATAASQQIFVSQAINNAIFVVTILCVLSYFFFSFDVKNKLMKNANTAGRWLLMVGLGAIFGSTVMARFALVIDRMFFIFIEFAKDGVSKLFGG
ncbi:MAG: hypothetical protein JNM85_10390 [Chthonomonas sp.]|nr:hypothetical protein [Chthonomonas sp.]